MKPIEKWTIDDCKSKEYWEVLCRKSIHAVLYCSGYKEITAKKEINKFLEILMPNNKTVAKQMLKDMIELQYIIGYIENNKVKRIAPIWHLQPVDISSI